MYKAQSILLQSMALLALGAFSGCEQQVDVDRSDSDRSEQAAATTTKEIHWVRDSAEYRTLFIQSYRAGIKNLESLVAATSPKQPWGVSFDIDETVLSNSLYQKERAALGLGYDPQAWTDWVARQEATPLPGASSMLKRVRDLGGLVLLVTNRKDGDECDNTVPVLDANGLIYDRLFCKTTTSDKDPRWDAIEAGTADPALGAVDIIMWVGDNIQDFPQTDQAIRDKDESDPAFAEFGNAFLLLPNPMYGSWENNPET